jgi:hypothetical protein
MMDRKNNFPKNHFALLRGICALFLVNTAQKWRRGFGSACFNRRILGLQRQNAAGSFHVTRK